MQIATPFLAVAASTSTATFDHDIDVYKSDAFDTGEDHDDWMGLAVDTIDFNAYVIAEATPAILQIGPSGNVIRDQNVTFSQSPGLIDGNDINLTASGTIVSMVSSTGLALLENAQPLITVVAQAGGNADLSVQEAGASGQAADIELSSLRAGGDLDVQIVGASTAASTEVDLDFVRAGRSLTLDDDSTGGSSTSLSLQGDIAVLGNTSLDFPNGSIESSQQYSLVTQSLSAIALDDINLLTSVGTIAAYAVSGNVYVDNLGNLQFGVAHERRTVGSHRSSTVSASDSRLLARGLRGRAG